LPAPLDEILECTRQWKDATVVLSPVQENPRRSQRGQLLTAAVSAARSATLKDVIAKAA